MRCIGRPTLRSCSRLPPIIVPLCASWRQVLPRQGQPPPLSGLLSETKKLWSGYGGGGHLDRAGVCEIGLVAEIPGSGGGGGCLLEQEILGKQRPGHLRRRA